MSDAPVPASSLLPHEEPLPPRWDLYIAVVWFVVGVAILALAATMPTFYERLQQAYTAPGLVPAVYGGIITLLSIWLGARSIARGALRGHVSARKEKKEGDSNLRLLLASLLCLFYAAVLIGHLPFWLATAVFVAGFILVFEFSASLSPQEWAKRISIAAAIGLGTGIAVVLLFEKLFLVRLP